MDNGYACYYRLRAYYFMGRTGYSNTIGVFAVNIDENKDGSLITTIYPNPFSAVTNLSFRLYKPENVHFTVYNVQSQIVFDMQEKQDAGEQRIEFNADGLPAGMYYYRIVAGDRTGSGKLVVGD